MAMIAKRFDEITKEDIESLVANGVREGRTIEYKQQLPTGRDDDKKEFLADISSFANASGGDLIYGVEESRDGAGKPTGLPEAAIGLAGINADQEVRRLENMIRDAIEPRIPGIQIRPIDGFSTGPVIIIRIPHSWASPHMVTFKVSPRFFSRTSAGKAPLDVPEIRAAFVQSEELPERIRRFREQRLGLILAGEAPLQIIPGPRAVFHVVPVSAFHAAQQIDVVAFSNGQRHLPPLGASGWNGRLNLDGYVSYAGGREDDNRCHSYSQIFRNGSIEAVDVVNYSGIHEQKNFIPSVAYEKDIITCFYSCLKVYRELAIEPPFTVMLSFVGVKGHFLYVDAFRFGHNSTVLDRDTLLIPEIVLEDYPSAPEKALRPIFDLVWQSFGFARSFNYDEQGEWKPR